MKEILSYLAIGLAVFGLLFFAYKLKSDEIELLDAFKIVISNKALLLFEAILLILNLSLESFRWKTLYGTIENISFRESLKTVLLATAFGNSTPGGIGEHIARIHGNKEVTNSFAASIVASFLQTITIFLFALIAILVIGFTEENEIRFLYFGIGILSICLTIIALRFYNKKKYNRLIKSIIEFDKYIIIKAFGINAARYIVFSLQLFLLLNCANEKLKFDIMIQIPIYYFVITVIPAMRILDVGIKGSVAIYTFGNLLSYSQISLAIISIWLLNTIIPSLVGLAIFFKSLFSKKKRTRN